MPATSSRYGLPCFIALSDSVVAVPSLLRVLARWALSVNQAGVVVDLRNVLFGRKRSAIFSM
eukprot:2018692-Pleurochrysis_carterae.AAC.1